MIDSTAQSAATSSSHRLCDGYLIHRHSWPNRQSARTAIFEYIEGFYNSRRRHSALGHLSPSDYEEARMGGDAVA